MVLDLLQKNEWQFVSKQGTEILPWYTAGCLSFLENLVNLDTKNVFEYGAGMSTYYYAKYAKSVYSVDSNKEWIDNVNDTLHYYKLSGKSIIQYETEEDKYVNAIDNCKAPIDIIIVDGLYRDKCFLKVIEKLKYGMWVIFDNWMQPSCEVQSEEVQQKVKEYPHIIYPQNGHDDWKSLLLWMK